MIAAAHGDKFHFELLSEKGNHGNRTYPIENDDFGELLAQGGLPAHGRQIGLYLLNRQLHFLQTFLLPLQRSELHCG